MRLIASVIAVAIAGIAVAVVVFARNTGPSSTYTSVAYANTPTTIFASQPPLPDTGDTNRCINKLASTSVAELTDPCDSIVADLEAREDDIGLSVSNLAHCEKGASSDNRQRDVGLNPLCVPQYENLLLTISLEEDRGILSPSS
jgi:hypothetical protein